jgi:hypothetical protein
MGFSFKYTHRTDPGQPTGALVLSLKIWFCHAYPQLPLLHLKQPQFLTLSLTPLLNMSMSMFTVIGFFMLKDGNRRNDWGHACYITAISTPKSPNIPAELYAFSAAGDTFFPDHTIVFAIGKVFYPPQGIRDPSSLTHSKLPPFPVLPHLTCTLTPCPTSATRP